MTFKNIVGIDIAKKKFDAGTFIKKDKLTHQEFDNTVQGISKFINWMISHKMEPASTLICMEHTGHYIELITQLLNSEGYFVWVVSPLVLRYFSADLIRLKNDKADAKKLCNYATSFQGQAEKFQPDSKEEDHLKSLFRLRRQLVKMRKSFSNMRTTNQEKFQPCRLTERIYSTFIEQLNLEIKNVEEKLKTIFTTSSKYKRYYQILLSIPGIGPVCASQFLILTRGFTKFTHFKKFASFVATAPFENSSGKRKGRARVLKIGHKKFKTNLYMAVLRHIQPGGFFLDYYHYGVSMLKKHHNSVMNAMMNELIKIVFTLIQKDQKFNKEIYLNNKQNKAKFLCLS